MTLTESTTSTFGNFPVLEGREAAKPIATTSVFGNYKSWINTLSNYKPWINIRLPLGDELASRPVTTFLSQEPTPFVPRTNLGKQLLLLRQRAMAKGLKPLSADEVLNEVKRRRGEIDDEAHLH